MTTDETITSERAAILDGNPEQFSELLRACYETAASTDTHPVDTSSLVELIYPIECKPNDSLLAQIEGQLPTSSPMSPGDRATIQFVEQLFGEYTRHGYLHPEIKQALAPLRKAITIALLTQHQSPWQTTPDFSSLLQLIHEHCIGWHPDLGRASNKFLLSLISILDDLTTTAQCSEMQSLIPLLNDFFQSKAVRIEKLEKRLYEAEKGALHANHAKKVSARTLNQLMAGKKLPLEISQFLQGPIYKSMQLLLNNSTSQDKEWRQCITITETLIWSFQPIGNDDTRRQQVYESIAQITDQLRDTVISLQHDTHQLDSQLMQVETEHSESLPDQNLCVECFERLLDQVPEKGKKAIESNLRFAIHHRDIIEQFGRFPHRNRALRRVSTPEEEDFLDGGGARFGQ